MKLFTAFALAALILGLAPSARAADLTPLQLRCEYQVNPLGLDETMPRLSWQVASKKRGQKQSAYQVLVASSVEKLNRGEADLWDSGRVDSDRTQHVVYEGKTLASGQRCYWQVRSWDQSMVPSRYSSPAWWEMGLLRSADWSAKWVGLPLESTASTFSMEGTPWVWFPEGNPIQSAPKATRYFRRTVTLAADRQLTRATFWIVADNHFTVYVNGKEAGQGGGWQSAAPVDVLSLLKPGDNQLAVLASNADEAGGPAGLGGRLHLQWSAGAATNIDIDKDWKSHNALVTGWQNAGFDDRAWLPVKVMGVNGVAPWGKSKAGGGDPEPARYLRHEFQLRKSIRSARAYVSALGVYQLHLNGRRIGDEILAPGWTDYKKRAQYLTYDVTDAVRRGSNAVGAIVGDGWYSGSLGPDLARNHFGPSPPRLRLQIQVVYSDDTTALIGTDSTWRAAVGPILETDLYAGEIYDARKEFAGWAQPGFLPVGWRGVTVYTDQNPQLSAHVGPTIRVTQELKTQTITAPRNGGFVFDLGQNIVGWARLKVKGEAGTRITLRFAETLNPDGTVYRENLRRARASDTYILSGKGTEVFEPHFTYHGFRYVEVSGYPVVPGKAPPTDAITGLVFHSAMPITSRFECSNPIVERLYQNVMWGQRANMMSVPTDCPQRDERLGWMGDAQLFARTSCWNMDMASFYTKWMRDIVDAQSAAGGFSDVSPRVVDMADGAPAWAEAGLVVPWTVYQCYGDRRILERNYPAMQRYVDMLVAANPELLWLKRRNNDFGDWVPAGENTNKDLIACAYLAYDLKLFSQIAQALGKRDDAAKYSALAAQSRAAFNQRFLATDGKYLGDTQTAYAMAIMMDLVPADRREQVGQRLAEAVRRRDNRLGTGFIGTALLLPALTETGSNNLAYEVLQATRYPSWGYMIEKGATTIWELWNSDTEGPGMNSRNHFAFGTVAEWLQRYLGGIDSSTAAPGYREIVIRPQPGPKITRARTEYDSLHGTIVSEWKREKDRFTLKVIVPANTTASVYLPREGNTRAQVREGGELVWRNGRFQNGRDGIVTGATQGDSIVLGIGSGSYEFVVSNPSINE